MLRTDLNTFRLLTRRLSPAFLGVTLLLSLMSSGFSGFRVWAVEPAKQSDEPITFERHIRPILKAHCFHCHGEAGVVEGELDVRLRKWLIRGGESGEAIVPGDPDNSLLLERVEAGEMPPGEEQVSVEEVSLLKQWIHAGAVTARAEPDSLDSGDYLTEEERSYWAFQPVTRPVVPQAVMRDVPPSSSEVEVNKDRFAGSSQHVVNPIDAFVLRKLNENELGFSPKADRHTLVRRLALDLWGLPPAKELVEQFVADQKPNAYQRLVNRLLASPEYGERWGRHWLDVAGYADSDGYTDRDVEREFAYFYRDYVVDSLNADIGFDRFVREQLAGDELLERQSDGEDLSAANVAKLAATGFLRMAPDGTSTGGVDRAEAANQNVADTIQIMSSAFLGLTVGCARCHDHRYDPISQADYYRMRAIFEPALDPKQWKTPAQRRVSLYTQADRELRSQIEEKAKAAEKARLDRQSEHIQRTLYEELLVVPDAMRESLRSAYETEKAKRTEDQVALLEEYPSVGNITTGSLYLYAEQRARRAGDIEKAAKAKELEFLRNATLDRAASLADPEKDVLRELLATASDSWSDEQKETAKRFEAFLVSAENLGDFDAEGKKVLDEYRQAAEKCRATDAKTELAKMLDEIKEIRATAPKENFVRVVQEPAGHLPATHLFVRGDHQQPDRVMEPNELSVLQAEDHVAISADDPSLPTTGRRLAYAKHLTSGRHPLLARVIVNRMWMHHFGRGIVSTPGDFGMLGADPTHPELLDWLASELMNSDWSLKHLHRLILLSGTYQQRSLRTSELDEKDPDNRLLGRMSVRRLESEAVRDSMLWISDELVPELFGPPVSVKEDSVGQIVVGKEMLDGERKPTGGDNATKNAFRRSLYIQVRRSRPLAVLETFDLPIVSPNCELRVASNVATQSLMMMNSQFAIDRASQLSLRLLSESDDLPKQLEDAWWRCFSRPIGSDDLQMMTDFVLEQTKAFASMDPKRSESENQKLALASACQAMMSANAFLYVD